MDYKQIHLYQERLKPCPVCGSKPDIFTLVNSYLIECPNCEGPMVSINRGIDNAIRHWNRITGGRDGL